MWCKFAILLVSLVAVNANNICKNAREGAIIPDGKDCTVYHQCVNLKLVDKKCDENMSFDAKSKTCVATADANCYGIDAFARRFPVIPPWFAIPDNLFPGGLFPDGLFPTPEGPEEKEKKTEVSPQKHRCPTAGFMMIPLAGHCEKYLLCFGGHPVKRSCAPGMHFSREYRRCMPADSADCIATECPEEDDYENPTFIPNPYDCNAYYLCYGGEKFAFECYEDLHWDPINQWCDKEDKAGCEADEAKEFECPSDVGLSYYPHPEYCHKFFMCNNGNKMLLACRAGFYWDVRFNQCNMAHLVDCDL